MPDASPTRWHLAHTTWFFETFVLSKASVDYEPFNEQFAYLFNSYYNTVGQQFPRAKRGLISRPTVDDVFDYREFIDERIESWFCDTDDSDELLDVIELGLQHEQQHQELMLTDIKHVLSCNPIFPAYQRTNDSVAEENVPLDWIDGRNGVQQIGFAGDGFSFDNEQPRHKVFAHPHQLSSRLISNAEYLEFINDDGYQRPELWLSAGWQTVQELGWQAPLYWHSNEHGWFEFTLHGLEALNPTMPVCHVSYFEAEAFARWANARLPTEAEWELGSANVPIDGNFVESGVLHPTVLDRAAIDQPAQMFGDAWEWTASAYSAYPGYKPPIGALGEYNGKFMCNQFVLRGGSCATPQSHMRATYRNFFPPDARWQFSGIRLAR